MHTHTSAYWPTQKKTQKKSQAQSGSLSEAEEDDRPLLPKRKPRLLVEDDNEQNDNVDFIPTGQTAGRRGTQRNQVRDNQATLGTSTQRTRRAGSVASDTYDIQPARSDTSKTVTSKTAPKATAARGRKKQLLEDNETTIDWGSAPSIARGKNSFASTGTATLDDDPSSTTRKGTQKRKALAVNVDDDEGVGQPFFSRTFQCLSINRVLGTLGRGEDVDAQNACLCWNSTGPQLTNDCEVLLSINALVTTTGFVYIPASWLISKLQQRVRSINLLINSFRVFISHNFSSIVAVFISAFFKKNASNDRFRSQIVYRSFITSLLVEDQTSRFKAQRPVCNPAPCGVVISVQDDLSYLAMK